MKKNGLTGKITEMKIIKKDDLHQVNKFVLCDKQDEKKIDEQLKLRYETLVQMSNKYNIPVSTMESCTAGYIGKLIKTAKEINPAYKGTNIVYSNVAKKNANVPENIVDRFSVYSREVARNMSRNAYNNFISDGSGYTGGISLSTTGTGAGVDSSNWITSKPGIIYISVKSKLYSHTEKIDIAATESKDFNNKVIALAVANLYEKALLQILESKKILDPENNKEINKDIANINRIFKNPAVNRDRIIHNNKYIMRKRNDKVKQYKDWIFDEINKKHNVKNNTTNNSYKEQKKLYEKQTFEEIAKKECGQFYGLSDELQKIITVAGNNNIRIFGIECGNSNIYSNKLSTKSRASASLLGGHYYNDIKQLCAKYKLDSQKESNIASTVSKIANHQCESYGVKPDIGYCMVKKDGKFHVSINGKKDVICGSEDEAQQKLQEMMKTFIVQKINKKNEMLNLNSMKSLKTQVR